MTKVTRKYGELELVFGPLTVGFMKKNKAVLKKVGRSGASFDDVEELMPAIYTSAKKGMGEGYPGDEAVDDAIDLETFHDAILAVFEAIGFTFAPVVKSTTPGDAPGEALPAAG